MMSVIDVVAILSIKPGYESEVAEAMKACVAPTLSEPGNLAYTPFKDLDTVGKFMFIERWESREALAAHMETPHFKKMAAALENMLAAPLQVHILTPL
ncbi:MAG: antibiotic biosynthesis monooxygenase [Acetobacter sp.]|jgi:quinol monooxygenase YgiN|nr:antibiotic biosynthesis monooxygenase [Acetobacter sp.]MCI1372686.1 antibiotic biosynthesis monooxygenase [Acetobacter sp.]MCI1528459.1 antibiotic biosynthesis monooxygenase [Acetobacter sp.]MCI1586579.1 antibiotic biosynthesis monooxygenase [Acetobacter sp.]MCI1600252.1 antibiotic biosynthesis monooxygenase [Acetobacter sp.]